MNNVSVHETPNHIVIVIAKAVTGVAGQAGPVVNQATPPIAVGPVVNGPTPAPVPSPIPAGPGMQNWTAGGGPTTDQRSEADQAYLDTVLKGG